jgi:hypothetical protein
MGCTKGEELNGYSLYEEPDKADCPQSLVPVTTKIIKKLLR